MSEEQRFDDNDIISKLRKRVAIAEVRVSDTRKNLKLKADFENVANMLERRMSKIKQRMYCVNKEIKALETYIADKKKRTKQGIYDSIYYANQIVPATSRVKLIIDNKRAYLEDEEGRDVDLCEASSWRAMTSVLVRQAVLSNTSYIPDLILDEPLAVLDSYSSADFSTFLPLLAKDRLIILMEQKDSIFANADITEYHFELINGRTTVKRIK